MPVLEDARHELFCQEVATGKDASQAYVAAGFKANRGNASTLRSKPHIQARIEEILAGAAERAEVTIYDIAKQLDEDRQFARELEVPSAAISATMGKAKVLGLLTDRVEHTGADGGPIQTEDVSARDVLFGRIAGLAERGRATNGSGRPH